MKPNTLANEAVSLRLLEVSDFESLYLQSCDPKVWAMHPDSDRYKRYVFKRWFEDALLSKTALVVLDSVNKTCGSTRFYDYDESNNSVAIGYTFLGVDYWGGKINTPLKKIMIEHAFQRVDKIFFHIDPNNYRSQNAVKKLGAVFHSEKNSKLSGELRAYQYFVFNK